MNAPTGLMWPILGFVLVFSVVESAEDRPIAGLAKFSFGTPTAVTRAGFTKVTTGDIYSPEKGFGFESTDGLLAFDRGGSEIARPKDEYTASVYGAYRMTSDITCALVEGTSNNAILISLPDGAIHPQSGGLCPLPLAHRAGNPGASRRQGTGPPVRRNRTQSSSAGNDRPQLGCESVL